MKKKSFFISFAMMFALTSSAQFKVNGYGLVGIGTTPTSGSSLLNVGGNGNTNSAASFRHVDNTQYAVNIYNKGTNSTQSVGLYVENIPQTNIKTIGIKVAPSTSTSTKAMYGIHSLAGRSTLQNIGVFAGLYGNNASKAAAVFGSTSSSDSFTYTGVYAGYFNGDVRVTGTAYCSLLSPSPVSQASQVAVLEEESVLDRLCQLQALQVLGNNEEEHDAPLVSESDIEDGMDTNMSETAIKTQMADIRYAINTEGLEDIFPELVYKDGDGNYSINYIEMIPLLVQSIKELKSEIAELKGYGQKRTASINTATAIDNEDTQIVTLSQNHPNPFNETTTIDLYVPQNVRNASILIFDMSGKQVKQIEVYQRGKTSISISSENMTPGMYLYSLISDGKVVSTKRMIISK